MKLRGALLGAGNIALRGHAPQWSGDPVLAREVEIVAIADLSPTNLDAARAFFPAARSYASAAELLAAETLDFVDICAPPFAHRSLVEAAAARGVNVLCEKPLAPCLEDAEAIAQVVRSSGIVFAPCHQYHFSPQWQAVVRLLPRIGRIHLVEYEVHRTEANPGNANWSPAWRTDPRMSGGGILFDHGAHIFYQLRGVLGEPAAVQATVRTLSHSEYRVEDSAFVGLDYGDKLAEVRLTWAARRRSIRFHFVGETGELLGDDSRVVVRAQTTEELSFEDAMSGNSAHSEWYAPLMQGFVERVRAKDVSPEPLDEALHVSRVIAAAYASSEERRSIVLISRDAPLAEVGPTLTAVAAAVSRAVESPDDDDAPSAPAARSVRSTPWAVRAAGLVLLVAASGWALHDVNGSALRRALSNVDPFWVLIATVVNLGAVYAMAGRWLAVLKPLAPFLRQIEAFEAMLMGFAVSTIVPARAGEIARAEWLGRKTGLPRAAIFGSIVLDHLVNAVGMFLGLALLPLLTDLPGWLHSGIGLAVLVFLVAAAAVFLLRPRRGQPTPEGGRSTAGSLAAAAIGFLARSRVGLAAMQDRMALLRSFAASLVAWTLELQVVFFALKALHIHASFGVCLLVLMAVNLALVVPFAPPANLGALEVGATLALMEAGIPKEQALAAALVYHLLQVIPIAFAGLALASRTLLRPAPAAGTSASS